MSQERASADEKGSARSSGAAPPDSSLPTPAKKRRDREVWVGLFVIAGVLLTVSLLLALTDPSMLRGRYIVTTRVEDAAGIRRGDPVQLRGVRIGRVKRFAIGQGGVVIALELERAYRVPCDSRVHIVSAGLLGDMVAEVIPGESDVPVKGGGELAAAPRATGPARGLAGTSEAVLKRLQALLSDKTIDGVEESSATMAELLKNLNASVVEQRASLSMLSATLLRTADNMEQVTGPELQRSVARVDALTQRLAGLPPRIEGAVASLDRASHGVESLVANAERGDGTLGRLMSDDALYLNANQAAISVQRAARELGLLSEDIRRNPKRYVKLSLF